MNKIRTHYDNLKVARDAPDYVIRAAYKALAQKYHPDRNLGNNDAEKSMVIINAAYEVLSDQNKRAEYDACINIQFEKSASLESKYPLHWASYMQKYGINKDYLEKVVANGTVKGSIESGPLFLEDTPPCSAIEGFLRKIFT